MRFTIKDRNGNPCTGRGRLVSEDPLGVVVELLSDDLGGWGTYRREMQIRLSWDEVTLTRKRLKHGQATPQR